MRAALVFLEGAFPTCSLEQCSLSIAWHKYKPYRFISMSLTETVDDLAQFELSRFESELPPQTVTEHPVVAYPKATPMTVQSKLALNGPDRMLFRLNK